MNQMYCFIFLSCFFHWLVGWFNQSLGPKDLLAYPQRDLIITGLIIYSFPDLFKAIELKFCSTTMMIIFSHLILSSRQPIQNKNL